MFRVVKLVQVYIYLLIETHFDRDVLIRSNKDSSSHYKLLVLARIYLNELQVYYNSMAFGNGPKLYLHLNHRHTIAYYQPLMALQCKNSYITVEMLLHTVKTILHSSYMVWYFSSLCSLINSNKELVFCIDQLVRIRVVLRNMRSVMHCLGGSLL